MVHILLVVYLLIMVGLCKSYNPTRRIIVKNNDKTLKLNIINNNSVDRNQNQNDNMISLRKRKGGRRNVGKILSK